MVAAVLVVVPKIERLIVLVVEQEVIRLLPAELQTDPGADNGYEIVLDGPQGQAESRLAGPVKDVVVIPRGQGEVRLDVHGADALNQYRGGIRRPRLCGPRREAGGDGQQALTTFETKHFLSLLKIEGSRRLPWSPGNRLKDLPGPKKHSAPWRRRSQNVSRQGPPQPWAATRPTQFPQHAMERIRSPQRERRPTLLRVRRPPQRQSFPRHRA